jgi:hypothetical protein
MFAAISVVIPKWGGICTPRFSRNEPIPKDRNATKFHFLNPHQLPYSRQFLARHKAKKNDLEKMRHCRLYKLPEELLDTMFVELSNTTGQFSLQASYRQIFFSRGLTGSVCQRKNYQRRMWRDRLLWLADPEVQRSGSTRLRSQLRSSVCTCEITKRPTFLLL